MLVIGNKKYRNLQEQVGWNTEQIEKIFEFLDGINVSDNVVVVLDISTPLTTEELEIVNREVAFIVYNGELYFKRNQDSTYIYFDIVFQVSQGTVVTLTSSEISVTKSNGALGITNPTVELYSKTQIDNNFASLSYVSTQLAAKANLAGAAFTGPITSPSIIEDMVGYAFSPQGVPTNFTFNFTYAGVAKNGNKITFVIALEITKTGAGDNDASIGEFSVPSSIYDKLYPVKSNWLSMDKLYTADDYNSGVDLTALFIKTGGLLRAYLYGFNNFTLNKTYYVRYEKTFLLSDNLAS